MTKVLNIVGAFFIVVGVIVCLIRIEDVKDAKESSKFWEDSARRYSDNDLIAARADEKAAAYTSEIIVSAVTLVSGIVFGVFFLALSKIITVLESIRDKKIEIPQENAVPSSLIESIT